ncbi:hypothetical protein JL100_006010 [Skermanella mucosa]|uniref:hypothetical protein n=1 Tax=Skermanella mucosa TaxID=1789672 RepID=UPI00192B210C|nr:hypothetical protein [Skermanella mucosa]UEM22300.1 hypothetical protein JL100_006010 [Skermanella mucosa]
MVFFSIMAHQAYACAAFWTYSAEMTLAMYKCVNTSMDVYLSTLAGTDIPVRFTDKEGRLSGEGRSADVIPFPFHRLGSTRAK